MISLIRADVKRILRKPTYRLVLCICMAIIIGFVIYTKMNVWNGLAFASRVYDALSIAGVILGIAIFLTVYAEEFSSNSMQCMIGRGISRFKIIISKLCNCIILSFLSFGILLVLILLLALVLGAHMNGMEFTFVVLSVFTQALKMLGFATVAMIVLFAFRNIAVATFVDVLLVTAAEYINNIFDNIPGIKFLHLEDYFYNGALDNAAVSFNLEEPLQIFVMLLLFAILACVSLFLSYMLFRKKELEF